MLTPSSMRRVIRILRHCCVRCRNLLRTHRFKQFNELLAAGKVLLNIIHSRNDRWLGKGIKHPF